MAALSGFSEHHQGPGAPASDALHAGDARGLPHRRLHHDPGCRPQRHAVGRREAVGRPARASSTCSRAARSRTSRSSRSASCRTSRRSHHPAAHGRWSTSRIDELRKEGEQGRRKINQYTRYGTIVLSAFQAFGIAMYLEGLNNQDIGGGRLRRRRGSPGLGFRLMTIITLTTGTALHHVGRRADHRARHRRTASRSSSSPASSRTSRARSATTSRRTRATSSR